MILQRIPFPVNHDSRGKLISLESSKTIPFDIKRVYYLYEMTESAKRGAHAHKTLEQVIFAISGSCTLSADDGTSCVEYSLASASEGLLIKGNIWREMYNFSSNCVLVVIANQYYQEDDYIRNYEEFLRVVNEK